MKEFVAKYENSHSAPDFGANYKKSYDKGYYAVQWKCLERPIVQNILIELKKQGKRTYLDFACGTGRLLSLAEEIFKETYGVDVSESMLTIAKQTCVKSHLIRKDITITPINRKFDVITAFRFFLNASPILRSRALTQLYQMLNTGGILIVNSHVNSSSILGRIYRLREMLTSSVRPSLGYNEFKNILNNHAFEVLHAHWYCYFPRPARAGILMQIEWLPKILMIPLENLRKSLRFLPKDWAQSFLLVCTKIETV